jgi:hypothetical protein
MSEYRHTETGEVKTQGQWRSHYRNVSLPRTWKTATVASLKLEAVLEAPKPATGAYETAGRNGVVKDANGNWVTAWAVRDMFADTTDEDGVTTTKAEHVAAYQAGLDATAGKAVRTTRNTLLAATDYFALTDVPMGAEMTTYRQALRDITSHASFPNLVEADWPVKPA